MLQPKQFLRAHRGAFISSEKLQAPVLYMSTDVPSIEKHHLHGRSVIAREVSVLRRILSSTYHHSPPQYPTPCIYSSGRIAECLTPLCTTSRFQIFPIPTTDNSPNLSGFRCTALETRPTLNLPTSLMVPSVHFVSHSFSSFWIAFEPLLWPPSHLQSELLSMLHAYC